MHFACRAQGWVPSAAALALAVLAASTAAAQTVTTGAIRGTAVSGDGRLVPDVTVTVTHRATGWQRTVFTDDFGAYRSPALPPGRYDIRAERLGFLPLLVPDVTVSPAVEVAVDLRLTPAEPPVTKVDTLAFVEGALHASVARGVWESGTEVVDLVDPLGRVPALAVAAAVSSGGLALDGLPDRLASVGVDGIPRTAAAHPGAFRTDLSALGLPFTSLNHAEIVSGTDVEWPGYGGALVSAFTARAPRDAEVRAYGDIDGDGSLRGAVVAGGPVVRDTAWGLLGVDARRIQTKAPAPWPSDSLANLAAGTARDSLQTDLSGYLRQLKAQTDVITAFGRFDWEVAGGQNLALRAAVTNRTSRDLDLGAGRFVGLGSSLDARDISISGAFNSRLSAKVGSEFSLSIDRSSRHYNAPALPGTEIVADGLGAGADGALPGRFERDATRFLAALHLRLGGHSLKSGVVATWTSHDISYDPWRAGMYLFGGAGDLAQRRGAFVQSVGGAPDAAFSINSFAVFGQDSWSSVNGLGLVFGARIEREQWPTGGVAVDAQWVSHTGLSNAAVPKMKTRVNPRFSFTWASGPHYRWLVRGDAGLFAELVDPSVLAEVLSHDGAEQFRRGLGTLGAWPGIPDSTVAPITGPVLTILNPGFESPRTGRVSFDIARQFSSGASLRLGGQYRHTDFLPRRSDLNLAVAAQATDQYGRPIYGTLQQFGAMLAATPGSNRRFGDFDRVWALDPSGYSDYWGLTVSLERVRERGLSLWASYTYSRTTDNTPGLAGSVPDAQLSPFPSGTLTSDWRDGRSDLDVPHRAVVGAQLSLGTATLGGRDPGGVRVAALVRYQSGAPFTPGFRDGVDANGDGAWGNDPAFVSDTVSGAADLIGTWSCLRSQVRHFAARNSCRGPAQTSVDARLVVPLVTVSGAPVEVVVDGINLVATNLGLVDRAVYLVDPTRAITTAPGTGVVTVPLVANPNFGKLLVRRSPGAGVRAGLRFNF
jgi:hypothetical protein